MRHRVAVVLLASVALGMVCGRADATLEEWAVGLKAGTLGLGGELTTDLIPNVNLRGSFQWLDIDVDADLDDVEYDINVEMENPMVLIDWYPFSGNFRVTGGVLFNGIDVCLEATPSESIEIGEDSYEPDEVGTLRGESDFDDVAPYVGIGFGNPLKRNKRWTFSADFGVAFIGSPNVDLTATGTLASNAAFQADLAKEEKEIEDDLDWI